MARSPGKNRGADVGQNGEGNGNGAFEAKLWVAADALRNNMDAAGTSMSSSG
jgi:type I restriction enzyme M protein